MKQRIIICIFFSSLLAGMGYLYFSFGKTEFVQEVPQKTKKQDFFKQEEWELTYINLKNNNYGGEGIKVAILDTNTNTKGCLNMEEEVKSRKILHGDQVSLLIKKISPKVQLYCIPVASPSGSIKEYDFIKGLISAIELKVDIINMSLGFNKKIDKVESILLEAKNKNIVLVAAAGNKGKNSLDFPANSPFVISVGAIDTDGERWDYSNYGNELDFVLPGTSIKVEDKFLEGTSFSAAILTGMIARLKEQYPNSSTEFIIKKLKPGNESNKFKGYGTPSF
ncbi:S8 family peptidase [Bacillus sp. UNC438CL73TsuS30]|uniref:S8 family peptidase n=1 Tax=Bacillus sp. UNC438CL73TsuS30 TaxID=1340434 RepID=UPI00047C918C|nr:S8 family serine peptidase [Bacillus sp. UNC438CL73TsuS30]